MAVFSAETRLEAELAEASEPPRGDCPSARNQDRCPLRPPSSRGDPLGGPLVGGAQAEAGAVVLHHLVASPLVPQLD